MPNCPSIIRINHTNTHKRIAEMTFYWTWKFIPTASIPMQNFTVIAYRSPVIC
jgi:hypothetical protein